MEGTTSPQPFSPEQDKELEEHDKEEHLYRRWFQIYYSTQYIQLFEKKKKKKKEKNLFVVQESRSHTLYVTWHDGK